jgi:hypothetical protein
MARAPEPTEVDQNEKPVAARGGLRVETWIFLGLTGFFAVAAIVYAFLAPQEPVGIVALSLSAGLTLIVGTFLLFTSRRLEHARPEDNDDAEVADGAGDIGFFSPGSYWPFFLAFSAAIMAVATAYLLWWLLVIGAGFLFYSICGLLFEYHRRPTH